MAAAEFTDGTTRAGMVRPPLGRDPHLPLYLLIGACVAADLSFAPLLPGLRTNLGLSATQAGLLLSVGGAATIVALPLGHLADRLGPCRLVAAAGVLAVAASLLLATADGFVTLLLGRILIGLTNAIIWTAGTALATDRPGAVARAIGAGGAGRLAGPLLAGVLAGVAGPRAVFVAAAVLALAATISFWHADRKPSKPIVPPRMPEVTSRALRRALRHPRVRAAALGLFLLGFTEGAANLLAPAELHAQGLTGARIGLLATIAAGVAFAAVTIVRRLVERHEAGLLAAGATLALGVAWLIPVAVASVATVISFLVVFAVARTLLNPVSYLLAGQGAAAAGAGTAITLGATNLLLGAGGLGGPVLASLGLSHPRLTHTSVALFCLASSAALACTSHLSSRNRSPSRFCQTAPPSEKGVC